MAGDQRADLFVVGHRRIELGEQALTQITGGDARRIERLHQRQGLLGLLKLLGRGVGREQIAKARAEVAAVLGIERADDPLAQSQRFLFEVQLAELVHQIVLQRLGAFRDVGNHIVGPLGIFLHAAGRAAGRLLEVFGDLAVEVEQTFEVVGVVMGFIDDERLIFNRFFAGVVALVGLVGQRGIALLQLQGGVLDKLLLDPLLQLLQGELQNLHRLDHPRRQLLHLELSVFKAEG
jgi:hypothetical protein